MEQELSLLMLLFLHLHLHLQPVLLVARQEVGRSGDTSRKVSVLELAVEIMVSYFWICTTLVRLIMNWL